MNGGSVCLTGVLAFKDGTCCHISSWRFHIKEIKGQTRMYLRLPGKAKKENKYDNITTALKNII